MKRRGGIYRERPDSGFSLLEMLVVIMIIALTAVISFASMHVRKSDRSVGFTVREVAHLAQAIRIEAISKNRRLPLNIDIQRRVVSDGAGKRQVIIPESMDVEFLTGKSLVRSTEAASIVFFPDGSSSGGAVTLSDRAGETFTLRVPWTTGIATIVTGKQDDI